MAFLRSSLGQEPAHLIRGAGLYLRPMVMNDYSAWAEIRARSRDHLVPWEPEWPRDELTRTAFRRRLRHYQREARDDLGYAYMIVLDGGEQLAGGITLSNVRRGVTQAASLGYWMGLPYAGKGLMKEAVRALIPVATRILHLHRIEAATMPSNEASIRVLEASGFEREGFARRYLKIAGVWQDHLLFAYVADGDA